MPESRRLAAWLTIATAVLVSVCVPFRSAEGQRALESIAVGATGTTIASSNADRDLRNALTDELSTLGGVRVAPEHEARWVVRGSVTRLDRRVVGHAVEVQCEVSLLVADRRGGSVRMMLNGRAGARGGQSGESLDQIALQAAVRGALRPLPRSLPRLR
jgi:hypothetical protein